MDKRGLVIRGRKFDPKLTARYYAPLFTPAKGKSRNASIKAFAAYFTGQHAAGRVPVKLKKGLDHFAGAFGSRPPKGSKVAMLPRKFSRGLDLRGAVPVLRTKTLETRLYFLDFLTPEWLEEVADLEENPEEQEDAIREQVTRFARKLPDGLFSVALLTGDYAKGSTFDRKSLINFLTELMMRFVRSKSVAELSDFIIGVNVITKRRKR